MTVRTAYSHARARTGDTAPIDLATLRKTLGLGDE
jgi:hypothetical protein